MWAHKNRMEFPRVNTKIIYSGVLIPKSYFIDSMVFRSLMFSEPGVRYQVYGMK